jgi:hypothetical protein
VALAPRDRGGRATTAICDGVLVSGAVSVPEGLGVEEIERVLGRYAEQSDEIVPAQNTFIAREQIAGQTREPLQILVGRDPLRLERADELVLLVLDMAASWRRRARLSGA